MISVDVERGAPTARTIGAACASVSVAVIAVPIRTVRPRRAAVPATATIRAAARQERANTAASRLAGGTAGVVGTIPAGTLTAALAGVTVRD